MELTPEFFLAHCKRRFGTDNPTRVENVVWEHMVRTQERPSHVRGVLGLAMNGQCHDERQFGPDWSFQRFGMSRTRLPDGRILCIAGEHEDYYDSDFCIYNDVILLTPPEGRSSVTLEDGEVEICGYPRDIFPPTDFHTATLVGREVYLVGSLGYTEERQPGVTPIYVLDYPTGRIEPFPAKGAVPGWISRHHASYDAARHALTIRGGQCYDANPARLVRNRGVFRLDLETRRWEQVAAREPHRCFEFSARGRKTEGRDVSIDLLRPRSVPHTWVEVLGSRDDEPAAELIVAEALVRFKVSVVSTIEMEIAGSLPDETVAQLIQEVREQLLDGTWRTWNCKERQE